LDSETTRRARTDSELNGSKWETGDLTLVLLTLVLRDGNSTGRDTNMTAAVQGVKDGDVADLAHYLAHFK
jgi:hypothetical protein